GVSVSRAKRALRGWFFPRISRCLPGHLSSAKKGPITASTLVDEKNTWLRAAARCLARKAPRDSLGVDYGQDSQRLSRKPQLAIDRAKAGEESPSKTSYSCAVTSGRPPRTSSRD